MSVRQKVGNANGPTATQLTSATQQEIVVRQFTHESNQGLIEPIGTVFRTVETRKYYMPTSFGLPSRRMEWRTLRTIKYNGQRWVVQIGNSGCYVLDLPYGEPNLTKGVNV